MIFKDIIKECLKVEMILKFIKQECQLKTLKFFIFMLMKVFLALIFGVFSIMGFSQNLEEVAGSDKDSIKIEDVSLHKTIYNKSVSAYIAENYRYPQEAYREGISGTIYAGFVVEKDGTVKDVVIEKGLCAACDKEAVRVIKTVRMNPIEIDGEAVRIRFKIPIRLMLQE